MIKNIILAGLLTGCATTEQPKGTIPFIVRRNTPIEVYNLSKEVEGLRYYVYSAAFVNAVQGCEMSGKICFLAKKDPGCQKKTETCVILNYRQWESVKKQHGWK